MTTSSMAFGGGIGHVRGNGTDVPSILKEFGIGTFNAQVAAQYVFMIPRTTDPDAQGVIMVVQAVQRGLRKLGANVEVSGILDQTTVDYLRRISGPAWHGKTWLQILGDILGARDRGVNFAVQQSLSGFIPSSGIEISTGSAFFLALGAFFIYRAVKR